MEDFFVKVEDIKLESELILNDSRDDKKFLVDGFQQDGSRISCKEALPYSFKKISVPPQNGKTAQLKKNGVKDRLTGSHSRNRLHVRYAIDLSKLFPVVRLERIDLSKLSNSLSYTTHKLPALLLQGENKKDEYSLSGANDYNNKLDHSSGASAATAFEKEAKLAVGKAGFKIEAQRNNSKKTSTFNFTDSKENITVTVPKPSFVRHSNVKLETKSPETENPETESPEKENDAKDTGCNVLLQDSAQSKFKPSSSFMSAHAVSKPEPSALTSANVTQIDTTSHSSGDPVNFLFKKPADPETLIQSIKKLFPCKQCSAQFKSIYLLKKHLLSHAKGGYRCKHCSVCFISKALMKNHKLAKHSNENPHSCDQCPSKFSTRYLLKKHLLSHSENGRFGCEQCPARFKTISVLKDHLHSHFRSFCCKQCSAPFTSEYFLKKHLLSHSDEGTFCCEHCSAKFVSKNFIRVHLLAKHSDERPFVCSKCSATFNLKSSLINHLMTHGEKRPFCCKQCSSQFTSYSLLKRHLISHSDEGTCPC